MFEEVTEEVVLPSKEEVMEVDDMVVKLPEILPLKSVFLDQELELKEGPWPSFSLNCQALLQVMQQPLHELQAVSYDEMTEIPETFDDGVDEQEQDVQEMSRSYFSDSGEDGDWDAFEMIM